MEEEEDELERKQSEELNITEYEMKIKQVFGSNSLGNSMRISDNDPEQAIFPEFGTPLKNSGEIGPT